MKYPEIYLDKDSVTFTTTYEPCKHLNGFYTTIQIWFRKKRVFCCSDCCKILDRKTLKPIKE